MGKTTSKKKNILFLFFILLVLIAGLFASLNLAGQKQEIRKKAAGAGVSLSLSPTNINVTSGETFSVGVTIDTGDDTVTAAELHFSYDQSKLEAQSISAGSFLPVVLIQGEIGTGSASITLGSQPTDPKKGTGIIATITFKALTPSNSNVDFASNTQVAAVGKTENALQSSSGSQVSVYSSPSDSPVPSSTPIPTNSPVPPTSTPISTNTPIPTAISTTTPMPTITSPPASPTCVQPPSCVYALPPCLLHTPSSGWCPQSTPIPTIQYIPECDQCDDLIYADFKEGAPQCAPGLICKGVQPTDPAAGRAPYFCVKPDGTSKCDTSEPTTTPTPSSCQRKGEGDANCDGSITGLDYIVYLHTSCNPEGAQVCSDVRADFNNDGKVNIEDYNILIRNLK